MIKLGIIGAGNMAEAIISGIISSKTMMPENIIVSNYNIQKAKKLSDKYGIIYKNSEEVIFSCDIIILAVKPYMICDILKQYNDEWKNKIIVSVAAGVTIDNMEQAAPLSKIIRTMPNTPVKVCCGVIAYCTGKNIVQGDEDMVSSILNSLGLFIKVKETEIDAVSALSGCSPAYMYQIIEAMSDAGVRMGLSRDLSIKLASMAMHGSGQMVLDTGLHPAVLKDQVTSPGGTTIEGLYTFEKNHIRAGIMDTLYSAYLKTISFIKK